MRVPAGCLTEDGLAAAKEHLEKVLEHWCAVVGEPRDLHRNEIRDAWRWGQNKVATLTDAQVVAQLGGHSHDDKDPFKSGGAVSR